MSESVTASLFAFLGVFCGYLFKHLQERAKSQVNERDFWQYIKELQHQLIELQRENQALSAQITQLSEELQALKAQNDKLITSNNELRKAIERKRATKIIQKEPAGAKNH